jgi:hypothetical protein
MYLRPLGLTYYQEFDVTNVNPFTTTRLIIHFRPLADSETEKLYTNDISGYYGLAYLNIQNSITDKLLKCDPNYQNLLIPRTYKDAPQGTAYYYWTRYGKRVETFLSFPTTSSAGTRGVYVSGWAA